MNGSRQKKEPAAIRKKRLRRRIIQWCAVPLIPLLIFLYNQSWKGDAYEPAGSTPEAKRHLAETMQAFKNPTPGHQALLGLFKQRKFREAEALLSGLNQKVLDDIIWEKALMSTLGDLSRENGYLEGHFDEWIVRTESEFAYLSRASFYYNEGFLARGEELANKTADDQFAKQSMLHQKAQKDLQYLMTRDSKFLPVFTMLIGMHLTRGIEVPLESLMVEATRWYPAAFEYRFMYMKILMPKWGGSYRQMQSFVDDLETYYELNPRLSELKGSIAGEKGMAASNRKDFDLCVVKYSEALRTGITIRRLEGRAYCLTETGEFRQAYEDISISLDIYPGTYSLGMHRYLKQKLGKI